MQTNEILTADVLDIIFDGKNKNYGAYELRKTYNNRLGKSVFFTVFLMLLAILGIVFQGRAGKSDKPDFEIMDTEIANIKAEVAPVLPVPPPKMQKPPEINQVKFVPPVIVSDDQVNENDKILDIQADQAISNKTIETDNKAQVVQAPVAEEGSNIIEKPKVDDGNIIFLKVEKEAEFPGGYQGWSRYLKQNLNPNTPVDNGSPNGTYQVIVKFVVSKDGSISDVTSETKFGYGMEDEAIKIIKRGPKWTPALQNGQNVNAYRRQPITFIVEEQ
jgi:protein TonB